MNLVIKYVDNYADKFDVCGLFIMGEIEYNTFADLVITWFDDANFVELSFGTNEYMEYGNADDLLRTLCPIADDPAAVSFVVSFGDYGFGWNPVKQIIDVMASDDYFYSKYKNEFKVLGREA